MEFDSSTGNLKKEYVYGGGTMVTIAPNGKGSLGVQYATSDHLGTPRVITNSIGSVVSRHDYMPFGEELSAGTGGRTTAMGFGGADNVRQKFTGYERDSESGLDYAQARYYANMQGRFTSPDPLMSSGKPGDPQTWNRYSYCFNNPIVLTDPSGMEVPKGPSDSKWLAGLRGPEQDGVELYEGTITTGMGGEPGQQHLNPTPPPPIGDVDLSAVPAPNLATGGVPSSGSNLAALGPPPQMPTSIVPQQVTIVPCPADKPDGIELTVPYQVRDSIGQPMRVAGMTPFETITHASFTVATLSGNQQTFQGVEYHRPVQLGDPTNQNGVFLDTPIGVCVPLANGEKFRHDFTQNIYIQYNGKLYPVRTQNWIVGSAKKGYLITNQIDIAQTRP
jgi:RHS repeat-associated protein